MERFKYWGISLLLLVSISQLAVGQCGTVAEYCYEDNETPGEDFLVFCPDNPTDLLEFELVAVELYDADTMWIYDGSDPTAPLLQVYPGMNNGLNGEIYANEIFFPSAPGGCITVDFASNFFISCFQSGIGDAVNPLIYQVDCICAPPSADFSSTSIQVCSDESVTNATQVTFDASASIPASNDKTITDYIWDFGDGTTGTGSVVNHTYPQPGGYVVKLTTIDNTGCESFESLQLIEVAGSPEWDISNLPTGVVCATDDPTIDLGAVVTDNYSWSPIPPSFESSPNIVNSTFVSDEIVIDGVPNVVDNGLEMVITLDIYHEWLTDMQVFIICPDGTQVSIINFPAFSSSENMTGFGYVFTMNASQTVPQVISNLPDSANLPPGEYLPLQSFDAFTGCPINGTWTIQIFDTFPGGEPIDLNGWSIEFSSQDQSDFGQGFEVPVISQEWSGEGIDPTTGTITTPSVGGSYDYTVTFIDEFGCEHEETVNIQVEDCVACPDPSTIDAMATNDGPVCGGESVTLTGSTTATGNIIYEWTGPDFFSSIEQNPTVTAEGIYTLTVFSDGCPSIPIETTVEAFLDCSCPTVTTQGNELLVDCETMIVDTTNFLAQIDYTNPAQLLELAWFSDEALTIPIDNFEVTHSGIENNCEEEITILYAALICINNPTPILAGQITAVVYPDLTNAIINVEGDNDCGPMVVSYSCEDNPKYSLTNDYDANGVLPDFSTENGLGPITFTLAYVGAPEGCESVVLISNYLCVTCPSTDTPDSASDICADDSFDTAALSVSIGLNNDNGNPIQYFFDNSDSEDPLDEYLGEPMSDWATLYCEPVLVVLHAFILCDEDGDETTPAIWVDLNYAHSLTIYPSEIPEFTANVTNGGCTVELDFDEACTDFISVEPASNSFEFLPGDEGNTCFTLTYNAYPVDLSCSTPLDICADYNCPTACPTEVYDALDESIDFCGNTSIDLLLIQESVTTDSDDNAVFTWLDDNDEVVPDPPNTDLEHSGTTCNPETHTFYLQIDCTTDSELDLDGGSYTVVIYPELNADFIVLPSGDCITTIEDNCLTGALDILYAVNEEDFTMTPPSPPTNGGELEITYQISIVGAPNNCSYTDVFTVTLPDPDDGCELTENSFDPTTCTVLNTPPNVDDGCEATIDSFDADNCVVINAPPNPDDGCEATIDSFDAENCEIINTPPDVDDGCNLTEDSFDEANCIVLNTPPNVDDGCEATIDSFDEINCEIINAPPNPDDGCEATIDSFDAENCVVLNTPPNIDDGCELTEDSFDVANCIVLNTPPNVDDGCEATIDSFDEANCDIINAPPNPDDGCEATIDSFDAENCEIINTPPDVDDGCELTEDSFDINNCVVLNTPPNPDDGCPLTIDVFDLDNCTITNTPPDVNDDCELTEDSFDEINCEIINTPPDVDDGCELTEDSFDTANCLVVNTPPICDDGLCSTADTFDPDNCICVFNEDFDCDDGCDLTIDSYNDDLCTCVNEIPDVDDGCDLTEDSFDAVNCLILNTSPDVDDGCPLTLDEFDINTCTETHTPMPQADACDLTIDSLDIDNCQMIHLAPNVDDGCPLTEDVFDDINCLILNTPPNTDDGCDLTTDSFDADNCEIVNTPPNIDDGCEATIDSFDAINCLVVNTAPDIDDGCELTTDSFDPLNCLVLNTPPNTDDGCPLTLDSFDEINCEIINLLPEVDDGCELTEDSFDTENCMIVNMPSDIDDGCEATTDSFDEANCLILNTPPVCDDGLCSTADTFDPDICDCVFSDNFNCDDGCELTTDYYDDVLCDCVNDAPLVDDGCELTNDSFDPNNCIVLNTPPNTDDGCILTIDSFDAVNCEIINEAPNTDDGCILTEDSFDADNCEIINEAPDPDDGCPLTTDVFDDINCLIINTPPDCEDNDPNTIDSFNPVTCLCENVTDIIPGCTNPCAENFNPSANEEDNSCIFPSPDDGCPLTNDIFDDINCLVINTPPDCDDNDPNTIDSFNTVDCICENVTDIIQGCTNPCADNFNPSANEEDNSCVFPSPDDGCPLTTDEFDEINCLVINTPPDCNDNDPNTIDNFNPVDCICEYVTEIIQGCTNPCADNFNPLANEEDNSCVFPSPDDGCPLTTDEFDEINCLVINTPPDCNDNDPNTIDNFNPVDCICEYVTEIIQGCTNPCADNFNPSANEEDNSCIFPDPDDGCPLTTDIFDEVNCIITNETPDPNDDCLLTNDSFDDINCQILNAPIQLSISPNNPAICAGSSVELMVNGMIGGITLEWDNLNTLVLEETDGSIVTVTPTETTEYTVTINGGTCEETIAVTVNVTDQLSIETTPSVDAFCEAGNPYYLIMSGATNYDLLNFNGIWEAVTVDSILITETDGMPFLIEGSDGSDCKDSLDFQIPIADPIEIVMDATLDFGTCTFGQIEAAVSGGTGQLSIAWNTESGLNDSTILNPTTTVSENTFFTITATDEAGCSASETIEVIPSPPPIILAQPADSLVLCPGEVAFIELTGAENYTWFPDDLSHPNNNTAEIVATQDTEYQIIGEDENGCKDTLILIINVEDTLIVDITPNTSICAGEELQLEATGGSTYVWTTDTSLTATDIADPMANPSQTTTYEVLITSDEGCSNTVSTTVEVNLPVDVEAGSDDDICFNQLHELTDAFANNHDDVYWSSNGTGTFSNENEVNTSYTPGAGDSGTVELYLNATNDCGPMTDVLFLTIDDAQPTLSLEQDVYSICEGESVELAATISNASNTLWSNENGTFTDQNAVNTMYTPNTDENGEILLTVSAEGDCVDTQDTVIVNVQPNLNIEIENLETTINIGESITLNATGDPNENYTWTGDQLDCNECTTPTATPEEITTYTVTSSSACSNFANVTVNVFSELQFVMPTAFSPNGDDFNDTYSPKGSNFELTQMYIFNRVGNLLYEGTGPDASWDGFYKGEPQEIGVYLYVVEYISLLDNEPYTWSGNVTLVR